MNTYKIEMKFMYGKNMTREEAINVMRGWVLTDKDREALETVLPELKKDNKNELMKEAIISALEKYYFSNTVFNGYSKKEMISWVKKQIPPKWLYRLEYKDGTCGLWYNGEGKWCFEQGIGSVEGCKTKDLPMDHDERYKQDGRDWFSSCSNKEDLMHWYSLRDAEELIKKGFVFTRYLATEYHEYENETVFIKESSLVREEIDIFELFGKTKPMFKEGDWIIYKDDHTGEEEVLLVSNPDPNGTSLYTVKGEQKYYLDWNSLKSARLWTNKDAKPGDIIVESSRYITIYQNLTPNSETTFRSFCFVDLDSEVFINEGGSHNIRGSYPATKEQRDLLFKKIKEAGYKWDEKNMKLVNPTLKEKEEIDSGFTRIMVDDKVKEDIKYVLANSDLSKVSTSLSDMLDWMDDKDRLAIYLKEANKKKQELANENFYLKNPKDGIWHNKNEEPEQERQVLICINGSCFVDFYHKRDKRFYMFLNPKHYLHEIDKWAYIDDINETGRS